MTDHREIHSPEMQTGCHIMRGRPACFCESDPPWPCGAAATPDSWASLTELTPGCEKCSKAQLAQDIYWGIAK